MADESCAVFSRFGGTLDPTVVHRFVVGEDSGPRPMGAVEAKHELGDPFATLLLLQGNFPRTAAECLAGFDEATAESDPLRDQMTFLLGEGSQIAFDDATRNLDRGLRFIVTRGATANGPVDGPDVVLSAFHPDTTNIELMAWDRRVGGFNYYRAVGDGPAWVFAGNARHALSDPTEGKGPFESHKSGSFLMKELKLPWVHWHSPSQNIFATAFAPDDDRRTHPWFKKLEEGGAQTLELQVAIPAMARWSRARFDAIVRNGGAVERPVRVIEQLVDTPTVNVFSSRTSSPKAVAAAAVDLPDTFFVDADGLKDFGLQGPPGFSVAGAIYREALRKFDVKLTDGKGFERPGDTHFAFVVPERAFEDLVAVRDAVRIGLVSTRLAACLLMVDFPNPVFSARRATLLAHTPDSATVENGASPFSQAMADAILAAAEGSPDASPEREFAALWKVGESFKTKFDEQLVDYYHAVERSLKTQDGFDAYFRLAESRRARARAMPIGSEFRLLFAATKVRAGSRSMQRDGTVTEA